MLFKKDYIFEDINSSSILRIAVPKNNDKTPLSGEQLFTSIHGILDDSKISKNHFSLEIVSSFDGISFYVVIPKEYRNFIKGQIYAQYPTVEINEIDDYTNQFHNYKYFFSSEISFGKEYIFPIRTFPNFDVDPLSSITIAMSSKLDEFQLFGTNAFSKILSESRKYRLNLILAHQYISQLEEDIQNAIFIGEDLISLEKHHFYIKLMIDGMISKPFIGISMNIQYERNNNKEKVLNVSKEHYSRRKEIFEDKINRWSNNN